MSRTLATTPPTTATAGDTWQWTASSPDFPVSEGWTLSYVIAGVSVLTWDASWVTDDGTEYTVEVPSTATAVLSPGRYEVTRVWTGTSTYAGQRFTETEAPLTVLADPGAVAPGDRVAFAETNLAAVQAAITARLAGDQPEEYTIGNRSVKRMSLAELYAMRTKLQDELRALRAPATPRRTIAVRFARPV